MKPKFSELHNGTILQQTWTGPDQKTVSHRIVKIADGRDGNGAHRGLTYWGFIDLMDSIPNEQEFLQAIRDNEVWEHTFAMWDGSEAKEGVEIPETVGNENMGLHGFMTWWKGMNEKSPQDYPMVMPPRQWTHCWETWKEWMSTRAAITPATATGPCAVAA